MPFLTKTGLAKKISWVLFQCQRLDPTLKDIFTDPSTGEAWKENTKHRRPLLAATLETLAKVTTLNEEKNDTWSCKPHHISDIEKEMSPWIWITTCLDKKVRCSLLNKYRPPGRKWRRLPVLQRPSWEISSDGLAKTRLEDVLYVVCKSSSIC